MCHRPVGVQFSIKLFVLAIHFNSFSIEVNGAVVIPLVACIVTLILVNLRNCYNKSNCNNFRYSKL